MAKGQKRSSREAKKPKAPKKPEALAKTPLFGANAAFAPVKPVKK